MVRQKEQARQAGENVAETGRGWNAFIPHSVRSVPDVYARAVYDELAFYADRNGVCFPAIPTIAKTLGCSENAVRKALRMLVSAGLVEQGEHPPESNRRTHRFRLLHHPRRGGMAVGSRQHASRPGASGDEAAPPHDEPMTLLEVNPIPSPGEGELYPENNTHPNKTQQKEKSLSPSSLSRESHVTGSQNGERDSFSQRSQDTPFTRAEHRSERKGTETPVSSLNPLPPGSDEGFQTFWASYPVKQDRKAALQQWRNLKHSPELLEKILSAVREQKTWPRWVQEEGRFIPQPARWLEGERWGDKPPEKLKPKRIAKLVV